MKKIGRFNLIQDNQPCELECDCGWNIQVGGTKREDYFKIKKLLENVCSCSGEDACNLCQDSQPKNGTSQHTMLLSEVSS